MAPKSLEEFNMFQPFIILVCNNSKQSHSLRYSPIMTSNGSKTGRVYIVARERKIKLQQ